MNLVIFILGCTVFDLMKGRPSIGTGSVDNGIGGANPADRSLLLIVTCRDGSSGDLSDGCGFGAFLQLSSESDLDPCRTGFWCGFCFLLVGVSKI